jgi:hypothetical protein
MYVSLVSVQHFLAQHGGIEAVMDMTRLLNSGMPHKQIASKFGMSTSQFSEFHRHIFKPPLYILKDEILEFLNIVEAERVRRWAETSTAGARPGPIFALASAGAQKDH